MARRREKMSIEHVCDMYAKVLRRLEAAAGQAHEHRCCAPIILMARHICFALICARTGLVSTLEFVIVACVPGLHTLMQADGDAGAEHTDLLRRQRPSVCCAPHGNAGAKERLRARSPACSSDRSSP